MIDRTDEMRLATTVALPYAEAGCERVYLWPRGDEPRQLELVAETFR